jgi:DNA-binding NtrC family response regulator
MPTVLLVDDDDGVRQAIDDHLSASGFDVITAADTVMAQRQLMLHPQTDLCLVDLVMPSDVPDGATFARSVKSERPDMPVILMTGYYTAGLRVDDVSSTLFYKPFYIDVLVAEIERELTPWE